MNKKLASYLIPSLLLATSALAETEPKKEITIRRQSGGGGAQFNVAINRDGPGPAEMEKVAYLGIETMPVDPTVAAQLSLARETGLVVRRVADGSPADKLLQKHDILTKLDDQILIDMHQLSVLVRNHKAGDEVKLTVVRGGKETTIKAKLGEHEVPKFAMEAGQPFMQIFNAGVTGPNMAFSTAPVPGMFATPAVPAVPMMEGREAGDVMRMIRGDRLNWFAQPRVHVFKRHGGKGATILDLPSGNFVFTDDEGAVEVNSSGGKRELTVKNKKGEVTFRGPINSPEEHKKLPPEVVARLEAIGGADLGDDDDDLEVETKVLEPATKTRLVPATRVPEAGLRSL